MASARADQIIDHTREKLGEVVREPVDVILNLVRASDDEMAALVRLVSDGGVLVTTTTPAKEDPERRVRTVRMFVRSGAKIVAKVHSGAVHVPVNETHPLTNLPHVHERSAAGDTRGRILLTPPWSDA